jgi:hypothetical protein
MNGKAYLFLSIPYSGYLLCTAYSLFQTDMNTARYLLIALSADLAFMGIWGAFILHRTFGATHWIAIMISAASYIIYDFIQYGGNQRDNWTVLFPDLGWKGPVFVIFARMCYTLVGILSKKMLLIRGYSVKLKEKQQQVEVLILYFLRRPRNQEKRRKAKMK